MYILRIEHAVPHFEGWKKAFDSDPVGRAKSGVRRYRIYRSVDDENYVMVDLEFDTVDQAQTMLASLRQLWGKVEGQVMTNAAARIFNLVETK